MKKMLLATAVAVGCSGMSASAATFTPGFNEYTFPGSQFTVDAAANAYYTVNFGITVENSYLYVDSRDTFDGIGIANGTVEEIGTSQSGRINFIDSTDFVTVDWLSIHPGIYEAYSSTNALIDSFTTPGAESNGTDTLSGGIISYILFSGTGGYVTVSGLTYNYDGTTDGQNDDIPEAPLPAGGLLLIGGLGMFAALRRRKAA